MNTAEAGRRGRAARIANDAQLRRERLARQKLTSKCIVCGHVERGKADEVIAAMAAHRRTHS